MEKNLYDETIDLINESELPLSEIAEGAEVGQRWLNKVINEEIIDPGIHRIQRVYDFLNEYIPR